MTIEKARRTSHFESGLDQQIQEILTKMNAVVDVSIAEQGSNANGYYRKWSDGTLECWGTKNLGSININQGTGPWYSNVFSATWPAQFTVINYSSITNFQGGTGTWIIGVSGDASITGQSFRVFSLIASYTSITITVSFYAVGRWKA